MIAYLKGAIIKKGANYIILDVNNIGYKVFVNENLALDFSIGLDAEIFIHHHVSENDISLYGFGNYEKLELFELLISISGIGPRTALACLAIASVEDLKAGIASGDSHILTKVSGIGKKTAERVVLELKDKVGFLSSSGSGTETVGLVGNDEIDALAVLGYSFSQAREALSKVDKSISDSGQRIREALRVIKN